MNSQHVGASLYPLWRFPSQIARARVRCYYSELGADVWIAAIFLSLLSTARLALAGSHLHQQCTSLARTAQHDLAFLQADTSDGPRGRMQGYVRLIRHLYIRPVFLKSLLLLCYRTCATRKLVSIPARLAAVH